MTSSAHFKKYFSQCIIIIMYKAIIVLAITQSKAVRHTEGLQTQGQVQGETADNDT